MPEHLEGIATNIDAREIWIGSGLDEIVAMIADRPEFDPWER